MFTLKRYKDNYGHKAAINEVNFDGKSAYRLECTNPKLEGIYYHISLYDNLESAEAKLKEFSCGTFTEI